MRFEENVTRTKLKTACT